ncbi:MAG: hypothetical protein MZV63_19920, partial [Marinilabiliales bacterium]|nr:hypothetical protein [Marinilabiliales bacterium]
SCRTRSSTRRRVRPSARAGRHRAQPLGGSRAVRGPRAVGDEELPGDRGAAARHPPREDDRAHPRRPPDRHPGRRGHRRDQDPQAARVAGVSRDQLRLGGARPRPARDTREHAVLRGRGDQARAARRGLPMLARQAGGRPDHGSRAAGDVARRRPRRPLSLLPLPHDRPHQRRLREGPRARASTGSGRMPSASWARLPGGDPADVARRQFLDSVILVCEAVSAFARRHADAVRAWRARPTTPRAAPSC